MRSNCSENVQNLVWPPSAGLVDLVILVTRNDSQIYVCYEHTFP